MIVSYHIISFTDVVLTAKTKFLMGYSLIAVIGCNLCVGLFTLVFNMLKSFRKQLMRKAMLRKDKQIRTRMMKKYSPFALKMIIRAGKKDTTVE